MAIDARVAKIEVVEVAKLRLPKFRRASMVHGQSLVSDPGEVHRFAIGVARSPALPPALSPGSLSPASSPVLPPASVAKLRVVRKSKLRKSKVRKWTRNLGRCNLLRVTTW